MIDDSQNGTIGGRFCSLTVAPIGTETVGLFGIVLKRRLGLGDPALKTESAITPGHQIAVSLSPEAFHDLLFCPQIAGPARAQALASQPDQLAVFVDQSSPPDCGSADYSLMKGGSKLHAISSTFGDGHIHIHGRIVHGKEGVYCFRVSGTFDTDLSLSVDNVGQVQATLIPNPPSTDLSLDVSWYCALLYSVGALIGGFLSVFIVLTIDGIAVAITTALIRSHAVDPFSLQPISVGFANVKWGDVAISSEGLTLQGFLPRLGQTAGAGLSLDLTVATSIANVTTVTDSVWLYPGNKVCKQRFFHYIETAQDVTAVCTATLVLFGRRRRLQWTIGGTTVQAGSVGDLMISATPYLPLPDGTRLHLGERQVPLSFSVSADGTVLTLNDKNRFVYGVWVEVECTDASGAAAHDATWLWLTGDSITFEDGKEEFIHNCENFERVLLYSTLRTKPLPVPRDGDPALWRERETLEAIRQGIREGNPGVLAAVNEAALAFGSGIWTKIGNLPGRRST